MIKDVVIRCWIEVGLEDSLLQAHANSPHGSAKPVYGQSPGSRQFARKPFRFLILRVPRHKSFPPLMSLSGQSASQETKCAAVGQRDMSRPTSLKSSKAVSSNPGI